MGGKFAKNFYEIQRSQWRKSFFLLVILILFHLALVGFFIFGIAFLLEFIFSGTPALSEKTITQLLFLDLAIALFISLLHLYDAKKFGAKFIADRLQAAPPSSDDLYHLKYIHTVEEIRLACGLPRIVPFVLPSYAVNSMALIQTDGTPAVFVTEGLLAEFTRNELQTVVAHETAHIVRGDAFYMTLVCSLANFFERARQMLETDSGGMDNLYPASSRRTAILPADLFLKLSSIVMVLLSTLISRQREILADATAVEIGRNPRALARAIAKAHIKNSFVGDFNPTYSPLFLVPQHSGRIRKDFSAACSIPIPPSCSALKC